MKPSTIAPVSASLYDHSTPKIVMYSLVQLALEPNNRLQRYVFHQLELNTLGYVELKFSHSKIEKVGQMNGKTASSIKFFTIWTQDSSRHFISMASLAVL